MSYEKRFPDWEDKIKYASATTNSSAAAAASLGIKQATYKKYAEKYGCYITNQSGKGTNKRSTQSIPLEEILEGLHPQYPTSKIRVRLLKEGLEEAKCSSCNMTEWMDNPIPLELDHIDGNCHNHRRNNLRLLCPNCHALTETYAGRNNTYK